MHRGVFAWSRLMRCRRRIPAFGGRTPAYDRWLRDQDPARLTREDARRGAGVPQDGHHLRRLWRGRGGRAAHSLRHRAAHHLRQRMAPADAGHRAARPGAQRLSRRHLSPPGNPAGRAHPEGTDRQQRGLPAGNDRHPAARRRLYPHHRRRHRAHRRGRVLRPGGQCPHAVRRLLHAGKPRDDDAAVSGAVPEGQGATGRELSAAAAPVARGRSPAEFTRQPDHRRADARQLQLGLFRARLPRRPDGRSSSSRGRTCASSTAMSRCARPRATSRSTCSTGASTTPSSIR